ncbi:MAG: MMPL family transporter [Clostridiales bacterium]|nr:MMPL family transporter [Clostridiales bacterium]
MRAFYRWVVNNPKKIMAFFLIATVICFFLTDDVGVNYDLSEYLPEGTASTISLEVMGDEFSGGIPNARVMVPDVTIPEALDYKEQIAACEGVLSVTWLDDAVDIVQPIETLDADTVETYYQDGAALFSVTLDEDNLVAAVNAIRAVIGEDGAMTGDAVSTALSTSSTESEVAMITVVGVAFAFLILMLTTTSWLEPLVVLLGLLVAVVINMGTNLIFGEISFASNAAGPVLQMAVSLDYSVFLIHRFEECRLEQPDTKEAMVEALYKSTTSILSSGLTTVLGFLALVFMEFQLGPDLGLVLAKGVAISLITVFLFMPVFILATSKWLDKARHRSFMPDFHGFARVVTRIMIPMVVVFLVVMAPSFLAANANSYYYGSSHIFGEETEYGQDTAAIEAVFGKSDTYVLMVPTGDLATQRALSDALHDIPEVKSILSYVDSVGQEIPEAYLDEDTLAQLVSDNYSRMVLTVEADYEGEDTFALVETIRETAQSYYPDSYYLAGEGVVTCDLKTSITADLLRVNLLAIVAIFLVLLLTMKSISLPVILVLTIETAIWINQAVPYFTDSTVFYVSNLIISSIQLGATVDYAILLTDRYMEYRREMGKKRALQEALSAVTVSMLTSGIVLAVIGFMMGAVSSHGIISQLGTLIGRGSLLSLGLVLFVLPGLLYLLDGLIGKTTIKARFAPAKKEETI